MSDGTDDEEDYMSDKFLTQGDQSGPGLLWGKHAREHNLIKKKRNADLVSKKKPLKLVEQEQRDKGLETKISQDNRGFALLQKMGYKSGEGLGKNKCGRTEPIPISVKPDKAGLGKEAHEKRKREARDMFKSCLMAKRMKYSQSLQNDFRIRMRGKFNDRQFESDLYRSQKVCHQLQSEAGITRPEFLFFWPPKAFQDDEEDEDSQEEEDEYTVEDKLYFLTKYLRENYFYCLWCAIKYNDVDDLAHNCPGDTAQDHDD